MTAPAHRDASAVAFGARPPRVLIAIPHYYRPQENPRYSSQGQKIELRIRSLAQCLTALRGTLGQGQVILDIASSTAPQASRALRCHVDIAICTTGGSHVLDRLPVPRDWYVHVPSAAEPLLLGYECHAALRDRIGQYDYYGYMEDDLVVHDPLLIAKCAWFARATAEEAVLQPHRFELSPGREPPKAYIDGDIRARATAPFQDVADRPELRLSCFDAELVFRRARNPHAGCFFLSDGQMRRFASQPWFLDRATSFVGPLESAATLGPMRTFRVYKPALDFAGFLEIEHATRNFSHYVGTTYPVVDRPPEAAP